MSEKPEVGSIVEGKVVRIKPFGAIVSLGEQVQGLVHISQVANTFVQDINDHVKVGDIVKVKVLSIDPETNKIALSDVYKRQDSNGRPNEVAFSNLIPCVKGKTSAIFCNADGITS